MLVLTRRIGEAIVIGEDIQVQVVAVRCGQVSLGFTAPTSVRIYREEIHSAVAEHNRAAKLSSAADLESLSRVLGEVSHDDEC